MLIEACDLSKSFGQIEAVRGISFSVSRGERVGVLGANGAGKSTTLKMLAGTLRPDGGTARIASADVRDQPLSARAHVGYLPEAANGFSELTVVEFLIFAAEVRGLAGTARDTAVRRVLATFDLTPSAARRLGSLSKGWRQRAWLAQALVNDPPVLILDEPTDGLDPNQKIALRARLRSLSVDKAILISTHILEEAETLCDRLIVISDGRVVEDRPTAELLDETGRLGPAFLKLTGTHAAGATP